MAKPDKRKEILQAALELMAEQGFHSAPMTMIAQQAGVAAGTLYCYFESRDALITELFRNVEERGTLAIMEGYAPEGPIKARFLHLVTAMLRYFIAKPLDFRYVEQFLNSPYGIVFRGRFFGEKGEYDVYRELFEEGIAKQVIKDMPIVVLFALTFGPLLSVARDHILGFIRLDGHLVEMTVTACWDSVRR